MFSTKQSVLIGLIGSDIQGSLAPETHMREGEQVGIRHVYRLIDLSVLGLDNQALPDLLMAAERSGFDGLAITHPCKQAVIPYLTDLSEEARQLNAVNTIVFSEGRRYGHNTDWFGFAESFKRDMGDVPRESVVQLGAGGAGGAVAHAALTVGVDKITLFDPDNARASAVAANLGAIHGGGRIEVGSDLSRSVAVANGIINATPIGMDAHPGTPLPLELLRRDLWIADIIYFPDETELLRQARSLGARTINGGGMVVFQAAEQFRLFTGITPDTSRMLAYFKTIRQSQNKPRT